LLRQGLSLIDPVRRWSDRLLVLCAIFLCRAPGTALIDRFGSARSCLVQLYPSRRRPGGGYNGFIDCLSRHYAQPLASVVASLRRALLERAGRHWRVSGFIPFGVEGTKIDLPHTDRNLAAFGVASRKHAGPQALLCGFIHLPTRSLFGFLHDIARGSERALLGAMLPLLPADSLIVADAGFVGFETMKRLIDAGHHFAIRAGANVKLITQLGCLARERDDIVCLWPARQRKRDVPTLVLRRPPVTDARGRQMCVLVSVLDPQRLSDTTVRELYQKRWNVEVSYRWLKHTLHARRMLSASPQHARVELDWTLVGMWVLTLLALSPQTIRNGLSLATALRAVRWAMSHLHRGRRRTRLCVQRHAARTDGYRRKSGKTKRHWPRKPRIHRCGTPLPRTATPEEIAKYQALLTNAA